MPDDAEVVAIDRARTRCTAKLASGARCRNHAGPSGRCRVHEPADPDGAGVNGTSGTEGESGRGIRRRALFSPADPPTAHAGGSRSGAHRGSAARPAGGWDGGDGPADGRPAAPIALRPRGGVDDGGDGGDRLAAALSFLRRRVTGDYPVDVFGFDRELTEQVLLPLGRPLYRRWWRVRAVGLDNVPSHSGALIAANHSGTLPFDAIMTKLALLDEHPAHRHLRELAADLALRVPFLGPLARKSGNTLAHNEDAVRLLEAGELVGVWPEGFKGIGKPYRDRYKLERFGRGGFVRVALKAQRPIIPVAIIGAEEIYPMVANVRSLARLLGVPYFPITWQFPLLGPLGIIPLPSKWLIQFGEPIDLSDYGPDAADDPMLVFELTDRVRDTIQQMLYRNLMGRRSIFF